MGGLIKDSSAGNEVTETVGNVAGRTSGQGYGETDEIRKQYTGYERDKESGLDFAQARYYNSQQGRFTSVDPLTASANMKNPQTFNRYSYVLNSPYKFTDPLGLLAETTGACGSECLQSRGGGYNGGTVFDSLDGLGHRQQFAKPQQQQQTQKVVDTRNDKTIKKKLDEIQKNAKPLAAGETPIATSLEYILGDLEVFTNATVILPDGTTLGQNVDGYIRPIAMVILDQGGNIISDQNNLTMREEVTADSPDAKTLEKLGRLATGNRIEKEAVKNGVFYDVQARIPGSNSYDIKSTQDFYWGCPIYC